ncbi:hypothetical protein FOZG_18542 [Fusarium oxysporum Fo47]|uniref:Uncharacterized protein n=1 Tax=Fusarium oxysporum Fo47 TaxID=660027 RepID=W9J6V5_FUSOX|nr:hypothetical protein FOZG_18542 [Fusarium oxysporum Fo47]
MAEGPTVIQRNRWPMRSAISSVTSSSTWTQQSHSRTAPWRPRKRSD